MAWRGTNENDIEQNYNARLTVPEYAEHVAKCRATTLLVKTKLKPEEDISYGAHERETFDWYPCGYSNAPVHVYIHGGFWRANDKSDFGLVAAPFVSAGVNVAVINYPLCPEVSLEQVVNSVISAVKFVRKFAAERGANINDYTLAGHSAGAHLATMVLTHNWAGAGFSTHPVRAAVLISGIYELEPVLQISVNREKIHLTANRIPTLSPMRFPPTDVDLFLTVGGDESPMWMKQSADFANAVQIHGGAARYVEIPGRNHCNLMETFADPSSPLVHMSVEHLFPSKVERMLHRA
jgi:arylformamidase